MTSARLQPSTNVDEEPQSTALFAPGGRLRTLLSKNWMVVILVVLVVFFSIVAPGFLTQQNFISTTVSASTTLILGAAETFVILTGGIDLSVGAILGFSGMTSAYAMQALIQGGHGSTLTIVVGVLVGLATGLILGMVNGFVIAVMRITPFITTLGMLGIATGFTFLITNGTEIINVPPSIGNFGNGTIGGWFSWPFVVAIGVALVVTYVLRQTKFGLYTYAVGSNPEGARVSGVNVRRHLFLIYSLSGLLAGLSGVLVLTRLVAGSPLEGANDELNAIAAVVIGGASLFGGVGTMLGTFVGGLVIAVLVTGLVIAGVQPYWQTVAVGIAIILAVFVDQQQHTKEE